MNGHVKNGGVDSVEVWLEGGRGVSPHLMTLTSTLKENLNNKTIIEFPEFHVVSKGAGPPTATLSLPSSPPSKEVGSVSSQCQNVGTNDGGDEKAESSSSALKLIAMYSDSEDSTDSE